MKKEKVNFSLEALDAYANTVTASQATRLYESRLHKEYKRTSLNETFEPDGDYYTVYVDNSAIVEMGDNMTQLILDICNGKDYIKYKVQQIGGQRGVYFYATIPDDYVEIITTLAEKGYAKYILDNVEAGFEKYLEKYL